jgi:predicted Fe-Mo cluster-binding NifX family protein
MKIAIPATGNDVNSIISPRFGRSANYLIVDTQTDDVKQIPNPAAGAARGAGVAAAQIIAGEKVDGVAAVSIGPNAYQALTAASIDVYQAPNGSAVKDIVEQISEGSLKKISDPTGPPNQA